MRLWRDESERIIETQDHVSHFKNGFSNFWNFAFVVKLSSLIFLVYFAQQYSVQNVIPNTTLPNIPDDWKWILFMSLLMPYNIWKIKAKDCIAETESLRSTC